MKGSGNPDTAFLAPDERLIEPLELLEEDIKRNRGELADQIGGSSVLLIGGAGTIGSATLRHILPFAPARVTVVDMSENGLAELVRSIRSTSWPVRLPNFEFLPLDYGSRLFEQLLAARSYDYLLNFAALKHVRSERDGLSTARILEVNVLALRRLLEQLAALHRVPRRIFSVSTDKAANPVNLMGASKRIMEGVLFERGSGSPSVRTAARFANVAFSAGSLLESWTIRMAKGQPLACPIATRRFLVTQADAGRICLLAALRLSHGEVGIPSTAAGVTEHRLEDVAVHFLASRGFDAEIVSGEEEAVDRVSELAPRGRYPLLLTPRDTVGEKDRETFVGEGEGQITTSLASLDAVLPAAIGTDHLDHFQAILEKILAGRQPPSKAALVELMETVIPQLQHEDSEQSLDERM